MITAQPDDIKGSAKYSTQLNITAAISTKSTFLSLLDAGIIIAINIAYNVIPIASASDVGSRLFIKAPSTVPSVQPMYGIAISPSINGNVMAIGVVDATANTSSVMPNAVISLLASDILPIFCDRESDISIYRRFITNVVIAISHIPPAAEIMFIPANCPAEVRLVIEITIAAQAGIPFCTASIPNENETGMYPSAIGIPSLAPFKNCVALLKIFYHSELFYYLLL